MSGFDIATLSATLIAIVFFGVWKTRNDQKLDEFLKGSSNKWGAIGLSVMATQASAITFLSTPGLAYDSGMAFVQNYFGMPLALILIAVVFVPMYYKLELCSVYEFLEHRFDSKTRTLGSIIFLIQRGFSAGITIYAPSIILTSVLGWNMNATVVGVGLAVVIYTVTGGSHAVSLTHKYQMSVILTGMAIAFGIVVYKISGHASFSENLTIAGSLGRLNVVDFSFDIDKRYTLWSGLLGGFFLSLSYFGTDQSQAQRYMSGQSVRDSRLGLMFNALLKVPMQFMILLLGVLVFVFYQWEKPPATFLPDSMVQKIVATETDAYRNLEGEFDVVFDRQRIALADYVDAVRSGDEASVEEVRARVETSGQEIRDARTNLKDHIADMAGEASMKDSDYVFIHFILNELPVGLIGLLVAVILCAAMSSTASELSALATISTVDFYQRYINKRSDDAHTKLISRIFTAIWGGLAILFALFASMVESLIEAVNIVGSLFYGTVLGLFLAAFFIKRVRANAAFVAALIAQVTVLVVYLTDFVEIGYLWYNLIACFLVIVLSLLLQSVIGGKKANV
ncbi:MAG: sodium:solute symporter [Opitutales bacterium]|jgi:solute:Na+ symporter, SSS family|nr:sodium:solute symporter [Opitutales bacterium]MDG2254204.1 sodium:solute symporter [Opitutaceae bacterium]MBT5169229.1 sodium:solute symporter [Opitutales bacterium]MBT5815804.1 sodium:solute symporter [Opitutales bacterium]MBT6380147.1 sodium:solute symporter [Opitutales bacterium]